MQLTISTAFESDHCADSQCVDGGMQCFPHGGCWILKIRKRRETGASVLGKMWHDLVLSCVCEQFEEPDVVGVGIAIRSKEDLISVIRQSS